jgi:hypothetical protein
LGDDDENMAENIFSDIVSRYFFYVIFRESAKLPAVQDAAVR